VDAVNVIWSEPEGPSDALSDKLHDLVESQQVKFKFNINEVDELNNRFKPLTDIGTDAVFSIDDDVLVPCNTMDLAFSVWQSAPDQTVGFVPRMHWAQALVNFVAFFYFVSRPIALKEEKITSRTKLVGMRSSL
jgi:hypothetical protein